MDTSCKNFYTGKSFADIAEALAEYQGDSYPLGAFLEYVQLEKSWSNADGNTPASVKKSTLEAFAGKYAGKAVSMFAKATLLEMEFSSLGEKRQAQMSIRHCMTSALHLKRRGLHFLVSKAK